MLDDIIVQLNDETQLCLRDSMYRLARHSEDQTPNNGMSEGQFADEPSMTETSDVCSRYIQYLYLVLLVLVCHAATGLLLRIFITVLCLLQFCFMYANTSNCYSNWSKILQSNKLRFVSSDRWFQLGLNTLCWSIMAGTKFVRCKLQRMVLIQLNFGKFADKCPSTHHW